MKRFASLATTAALAGSLIGAGTAAQAASTMSLVAVSPTSTTYKAGDIITIAVVLNLGNSSFGSFSVPTAVGYVNSQFDDPSTQVGDPTYYSAYTAQRFMGPTATGGTTSYTIWNTNSPDIDATTHSMIGTEAVKSAQVVPGHGNTTIGTGATKATLAVPAGTYTLATFPFAVAATYTSGPLNLFLPTPLGYSDASNDADGAFAGSAATFLINGKSPLGAQIAESLSFPTGGQMLVFNSPGGGGGTTPAPSSLLVVAMGAIPAIGVLRRRRATK